jgi:hypothetical protein
MSGTSKKMNQKQAHESCRRLLERSVGHFVEGQSVSFDDVADLYEGNRNAFFRDCKRIKMALDGMRDWFDLLGISLPLVEYGDGKFRIPIRGFTARMDPAIRAERTALAEALIAHTRSGEYLVPRTGLIYWGFGSTVVLAAEQLSKKMREFKDISMSTSNVEILMRYYIAAPLSGLGRHFRFSDRGEIDWRGGFILPVNDDLPIATSIVSFESIDRHGRIYADTRSKKELVEKALNGTRGRIILIGEKGKFIDGNGVVELALPTNNGCEIYLFTNGRMPARFKKPDGVKLIVAGKNGPMNGRGRPKPK